MSKLLRWFVTTRLWIMLARHTIAHFTFRVFGYPKFQISKISDILALIYKDPESFYVFVSADRSSLAWKLNNWIAKSEWGHSGFIRLENGDPICWHMKGDGLNRWHLLDLLKECDNFALIKIPLGKAELEEAKSRLDRFIAAKEKIKYDYQIELTEDVLKWVEFGGEMPKSLKLYCSEMIYAVCYKLIKHKDFEPRLTLNIPVFEPDQVILCGEVMFKH